MKSKATTGSPCVVILLVIILGGCSTSERQTQLSSSLSFGDFEEWRGASQMEIHAITTNDMDLVLVYPSGQRRIAFDSWPSLITEDSLYFGPPGSSLRFHYRRQGKVLHLRLDSASNTVIVAQLKRIGPPPSESERLPGMYWRHKELSD